MQRHARCTHVQVASATLGYITGTVATQLATNTVIIFFLYNGCLLLCPYRLWHMRPRSIRLIPSLSANAKLSKVEQNTHMAVQLRCRACPDIADNPPLPQPCKEVLHPCTIEAMDTLFTSYNNPIERKKERKPLFASFSSRGKARGRDLQTPDCLLLEPGYESSRQGSSDAGIGELNIAT